MKKSPSYKLKWTIIILLLSILAIYLIIESFNDGYSDGIKQKASPDSSLKIP